MVQMKTQGLIILLLLLQTSIVIGAGGGGGGYRNVPACTEDIWTCSDFSSCSTQETQTRSCTLTVDCPTATTQKPVETASCTYVSELLTKLKCSSLSSVSDRVRCRLRLTDEVLSSEIQIQFLPEECRTIPSIAQRETCVQQYATVQKCWIHQGEDRVSCVKKSLRVGDIASQKRNCKGDQKCLTNVKNRVYQLIKWRFYNLEERAEEMLEEGRASEDQVTSFITDLETKKAAFNSAKTKIDRRQIILDVRTRWQQFKKELKEKEVRT